MRPAVSWPVQRSPGPCSAVPLRSSLPRGVGTQAMNTSATTSGPRLGPLGRPALPRLPPAPTVHRTVGPRPCNKARHSPGAAASLARTMRIPRHSPGAAASLARTTRILRHSPGAAASLARTTRIPRHSPGAAASLARTTRIPRHSPGAAASLARTTRIPRTRPRSRGAAAPRCGGRPPPGRVCVVLLPERRSDLPGRPVRPAVSAVQRSSGSD